MHKHAACISFDPGMLIARTFGRYNVVSPPVPGFPVCVGGLFFCGLRVCLAALHGRPLECAPVWWCGWCRVGIVLCLCVVFVFWFVVCGWLLLFLGGVCIVWGVYWCLLAVCWLGVSCECRACRARVRVCERAGQQVFF